MVTNKRVKHTRRSYADQYKRVSNKIGTKGKKGDWVTSSELRKEMSHNEHFNLDPV